MSTIQSLSLENAAMMKELKEVKSLVQSLLSSAPKSKVKSKPSGPSDPSASAEEGKDDDSVKSKRSIGAGTQAWIDISGKITPLVQKVKAALTEEAKSQNKEAPKFGPIHLKAAGYLKSDLKNEDGSFKEPSYEQVHTAVLFLMANPDYKSANADAKSKKEPSAAASVPAASAASAVPSAPEQKEKAKPGRKPDPLVAARKAKEAEEKAAKASAKEQKKPQAASNAAAAPASAWTAPSAEAEEEAEVEEIEIDGEELYYDPASGKVYERNDGALGDEIGTYDGITLNRTA